MKTATLYVQNRPVAVMGATISADGIVTLEYKGTTRTQWNPDANRNTVAMGAASLYAFVEKSPVNFFSVDCVIGY